MEMGNEDTSNCGQQMPLDLQRNPTRIGTHHQQSHPRKILEPLPGFRDLLTDPGVARTNLANPRLRAKKPVGFRDRRKEILPRLKTYLHIKFRSHVDSIFNELIKQSLQNSKGHTFIEKMGQMSARNV